MEQIKLPMMHIDQGFEYLSKGTKHSTLAKFGHSIQTIQFKRLYFDCRTIEMPSNHSQIFPDLLTRVHKTPTKLSISHQYKVNLNNPIYRVTAKGYNSLWKKVYNFIANNAYLDPEVIERFTSNEDSTLHNIPIVQMVTMNNTNGMMCTWEPNTTINSKGATILAMTLVKIDGEPTPEVEKKHGTSALMEAAGEIMCEFCNKIAIVNKTFRCQVLNSELKK